jgi:threonine dehydrogenase-like Zn-dependent dehydrogenase
VRFEERETPKIVEPTDAVIRISLTCVCGPDLWPYRGVQPINGPTPMGHEYCGIVEEVSGAVGQAGAVRHRLVRHCGWVSETVS